MSDTRRHVLSPDVPDFQCKRSSLPYPPSAVELEQLRFSRQLSTSQPKLPSKSCGSVENLLPEERPRSNSLIRLGELGDIKRNLSASNLAALSDSNLSIKKALPQRYYDAPNSSGAAAKVLFVHLVKRYFFQLTDGCGDQHCQNRFCHSCKESRRVQDDVAAIISIKLASCQRRHLCKTESCSDRPLPQDVFQPSNRAAKPFLHTLFSTTPFRSLFAAQRATAEAKRKTATGGDPQPGGRSGAAAAAVPSAKASLNQRLISAKPPSGAALRRGHSPLRPKPSARRLPVHSGPAADQSDAGMPAAQQRPGWEVGASTAAVAAAVDLPAGAAWPRRQSCDLPSRSSTPDLSAGLPGEADATHLLSDGFSSEENLFIHHSRSRSTPAGSYSNLSMSSAVSFGSGAAEASSPARLLSSQEALDETDDLHQFERELSLEASWDGVGEFSLTHLTLPMLEGAIETYKSSEDPSFLINTIRTVFTSSEALNASFRVDSCEPDSPIDLSTVRQAYALLWTLRPLDVFLSTMTNALEILLMSLDTATIQAHQINQILILFENPLLETPGLLRIFCHTVAHLPAGTRDALVGALSAYSRKHFQRLLHLLRNYLGSVLRPNHSVHENIICITKVLSILHEAASSAQRNMVELATLKDYYSQELSSNMDYMAEFQTWKLQGQRRERAGARAGSGGGDATTTAAASHTSEQAAYGSSNIASSSSSNSISRQGKETESLLDFPFLLDPASKVHILHLDAVMQMRQEYQAAILHQARVYQAQKYLHNPMKSALRDSIKAAMCPFLVLEVRREFLVRDTLAQMRLKHRDLKKPLKIKYVGGGEQGLDMGGLQKEFFQLITEAVFDPKYAMFTFLQESRTLWINGWSLESRDEFELVGSLLGLAIYNGIILDVHFPTAIYKKLHGETMDLQDLMEVQPSLGRGLQELLAYQGPDVETTFCQTFEISYTSMGEVVRVELLPNGSQVAVTNENREEFVRLYVKHLLVDSIATQYEAFAHGFQTVCGGSALRLFQAAETEMLVCGSPELDFKALEASTTYEDGYSLDHPTVVAFWQIVHSLSMEKKRKLLHFITGSDKVPLKGLSSLPIVIQRNGPESDRLPTAMTCFNRLLMPAYTSREVLCCKLLVAIENSKGFGLT